MKTVFKIKRAYEGPLESDGYRVLVDRLWPRGIRKEDAGVDEWAKDLAPSADLRKWYGHLPASWPEFQKKYREELVENERVSESIESWKARPLLTLVYGAKDEAHTHALVLQAYLENRINKQQ